jgi:hypothetical protein
MALRDDKTIAAAPAEAGNKRPVSLIRLIRGVVTPEPLDIKGLKKSGVTGF